MPGRPLAAGQRLRRVGDRRSAAPTRSTTRPGGTSTSSVDPRPTARRSTGGRRTLEELGVGWVTEGARAAAQAAGRAAHDPHRPGRRGRARVRRRAGRARLHMRSSSSRLSTTRWRCSTSASRWSRTRRSSRTRSGDGATVILEEGTWHEVEIDDETVEVLVELDGRATLAEAIDRARVPRRRSILADVQELLELGIARAPAVTATADLLDEHPDAAVCALAFRQFGGGRRDRRRDRHRALLRGQRPGQAASRRAGRGSRADRRRRRLARAWRSSATTSRAPRSRTGGQG